MRIRGMILAIFLMTHTPGDSSAGTIDEPLQKLLEHTSATQYVEVVARLRDRVDIQILSSALSERRATRQERAFEVITALQDKAALTQGDLLAFLAAQQRLGLVREFEGFWIDNLVKFSATRFVIEEVASRGDVEFVYLPPDMVVDPIDPQPSTERVSSAEIGLRVINAPALWSLGYTGAGRVVMNIDTGVDGNHPALAARWRGLLPGVQWNHAWYGPGTFPVETNTSTSHGTHVMGTMTGLHVANQDTLGVAPNAYWIAGTQNYPAAFQWAVNPDGNPATVDDIPDVINCSWFTNATDQCFGGSTYWGLMDNVEAVGAVVIWSAGNCGPTGPQSSCAPGMSPGPYMTITPPKNRVTTDVNAFAVGAVDGRVANLPIAGFSSRGPSACDTTKFKPEVSAPGVSVRSTIHGGGYGSFSGTSMSAPHVSGAVALLRQVNPNAEVDSIKRALKYTARDLGDPGPDNTYGTGVIDVFAAAERITPYRIVGRILDATTQQPIHLALVEILTTQQRTRSDLLGQYLARPLLPGVQVRFSAFGYRDTLASFTLTPNVPESLNVSLSPHPMASVSGTLFDSLTSQGVSAELRFFGEGDPTGLPTYITNSGSDGSFSVNAVAGTYRLEVIAPIPYPDVVKIEHIVHAPPGTTLSIGIRGARVFLIEDDNGQDYEQYFYEIFDSIGISYRTWDVAAQGIPTIDTVMRFPQPRLILWFTGNETTNALTASERSLLINHLDAGGRLLLTGQNIAEFSTGGDLLLSNYLGVAFSTNATGFAANTVRGYPGDEVGNGLVISLLGGAANQNSKDQLALTGTHLGNVRKVLYYGTDTTRIAAVRSEEIGRGYKAVFLGFGAEGIGSLPSRTILFERAYNYLVDPTFIVSVDEGRWAGEIPREFIVEQNYPNPFNPSTTVRIGIPEQATVTVRIFNALGQEVQKLHHGEMAPGHHELTWDGRSSEGWSLASGLYFIKVDAASVQGNSFSQIRKALLVK